MNSSRTYTRSWIPAFKQNTALFNISAVVLAAFVLVAIFGPLIAPYDPTRADFSALLQGPSVEHWLGTDQSGRDLLSRLLAGARTSLLGPLVVVVLSTVLGVIIGMAAGWKGGFIDAALSRIIDILFSFPGLLLAVLAVALFGKGLVAPVIAMSIAFAPVVARLTRALVIELKSKPFISAHRIQGFSEFSVVTRTALPNLIPVLLPQVVLNFGYALLDLAALSFLGLGVQPPNPDWGAMINESRDAVLAGSALPALVPSIAVVLVVVAFNIVGSDLAEKIGGGKERK